MRHPCKFQRVSRFGMQRYCTASSSGRQPNFAALNRGRHLCSAGRPSGWALAHILVTFYFAPHRNAKYCVERVCLSDGLLAQLKNNSANYTLIVTMSQSSSDDSAIRYVLSVLWMIVVAKTTLVGPIVKVTHTGRQHRGRSLLSEIVLLFVS